MSHDPSAHHGKAAYHAESATRHHRAAENAYGSGDHKQAALEAKFAKTHLTKATHHADLAAKHHLERFGLPDPAEDGAGLQQAAAHVHDGSPLT